MNEIKVDKNVAALKLIEILLEKRNDKSSHIYKYRETTQIRTFHRRLDNQYNIFRKMNWRYEE